MHLGGRLVAWKAVPLLAQLALCLGHQIHEQMHDRCGPKSELGKRTYEDRD